jgi:hypothetical protein
MAEKIDRSNLVEHGEYSAEAAAQERKALDDDAGELIKFKKGRHRIRLIPPLKGKKTPFLSVYLHYIKSPDSEKTAILTCPNRTPPRGEKRHCPICEESERLLKSGDPTERDLGYTYKAKRRVYCNVVRKNADNEIDSDISVWAFGTQIYDQLIEIREDKYDPIDVTDPLDGFDLVLIVKGDGKSTEYKVKIERKQTMLADTVEEINSLITEQISLEKYKELPSDSDLLKALSEPDFGGDEPALPSGESRRQRPTERGRGRGGGRSRRTAADDVDNDEVHEGEIIDDDDDV